MKTKELKKIDHPASINRPKVGDLVTVRGIPCRVFKIHDLGTIDVEAINEDKAFRISGLSFI